MLSQKPKVVVAKSSNLSGNMGKTIFWGCNRTRQSTFLSINQHQCSQTTGMLKTIYVYMRFKRVMCLIFRLARQWTVEDDEEVEREKRRKTREPTADTDESPTEETKPQTSRCENKKRQNYRENPTSDNINGVFMLSLPSSNCLRAVIVFRTQ